MFGKFGNCFAVFSNLSLLLIGTFLGEALRAKSKLLCKETSLRKDRYMEGDASYNKLPEGELWEMSIDLNP
jgi:hypothetical protein